MLAQVETGLPTEQNCFQRLNPTGETPVTECPSQKLHLLKEQGVEHNRIPVVQKLPSDSPMRNGAQPEKKDRPHQMKTQP